MTHDSSAAPFQAAVIQHPPVYLNLKASVEKALRLIDEAAEGGAKVIAFPETWLTGYPLWLDAVPDAALWDHGPAKALFRVYRENAITFPGPELQALREQVRRCEAHVVLSAHERDGGTLYNTQFFLDPAGGYALHRKLVPTYTERLVWGRGDGSTLPVMDADFGRLSGLICWEHWMPLARAALHAKGETVHVAQWPSVNPLHQLASRHYAFEGGCFVLAAGCVLTRGEVLEGFRSHGAHEPEAERMLENIHGDDDLMLMNGGSAIIAPDTTFVAEPVFDRPAIIRGEIDPARIDEARMTLDTDGHYSRPDVFHLTVDERPRRNVTFEGG